MKSIKHPYLDEELFYPDCMENWIQDVMSTVFPDQEYANFFRDKHDLVCVDVGANIGIVTGFIRRYSSRVYAIEPSARHFEALCKNKEVNGWDNVILFRLAIHDHVGDGMLNLDKSNPTTDSLVWATEFTQPVHVTTLSAFLRDQRIELVDFLKIDVEGAEYDIVACENFEKISALDIEFHWSGQDKCLPKLRWLGFNNILRRAQAVDAFLCIKD